MKFFLLINVRMPTIVGILTFMSTKNSILGLSGGVEHEKSFISQGWLLIREIIILSIENKFVPL